MLGDYWRWTEKLLIPLVNGKITVRQYIMGDYSPLGHSNCFTLLLYWLNYLFIGINLYIENTIGLLFYSVSPLIFYVFLNGLDGITQRERQLLFIIICLLYFYPAVDFSWNLVVFQYLDLFLGFLLLLATERYLLDKMPTPHFILISLLAYGFSDICGVLAGMATLSVSLFFLFTHFELRSRIAWIWLVFISVQLILLALDTEYKPFQTGIANAESLQYFLNHSGELFVAILAGFSQSLISKQVYLQHFHSSHLDYLRILGGILLTIGLILFFQWLRSARRSIFPIFLMAFSVYAMLGVIITRVPTLGVDYMYSPRYIRYFSPFVIGLVLLIACNYKYRRKWHVSALGFWAAFCFVNYSTATVYQYKRLPALQAKIGYVGQELKKDKAYVTNVAPYCRGSNSRSYFIEEAPLGDH